jgi:hypothetical protein
MEVQKINEYSSVKYSLYWTLQDFLGVLCNKNYSKTFKHQNATGPHYKAARAACFDRLVVEGGRVRCVRIVKIKYVK